MTRREIRAALLDGIASELERIEWGWDNDHFRIATVVKSEEVVIVCQIAAELARSLRKRALKLRQSSPCTGFAATWCPLCGDCTCPKLEDGSRVQDGGNEFERKEIYFCALHGQGSTHGSRRTPR